jgi:hypothetical protein
MTGAGLWRQPAPQARKMAWLAVQADLATPSQGAQRRPEPQAVAVGQERDGRMTVAHLWREAPAPQARQVAGLAVQADLATPSQGAQRRP